MIKRKGRGEIGIKDEVKSWAIYAFAVVLGVSICLLVYIGIQFGMSRFFIGNLSNDYQPRNNQYAVLTTKPEPSAEKIMACDNEITYFVERVKVAKELEERKVSKTCTLISNDSDSLEWTPYVITAYCSCEKCCGKYAATNTDENGNVHGAAGSTLVPGVSVAACECFPFGTVIDINGYGEVVVQDRMSHKDHGNHLDLYMSSHEEALQWGRQERSAAIVK